MELRSEIGLSNTLEDIKTGKLFPVYLVCGDDNYEIIEATHKIIENILSEREKVTNLEIVEGGDEDWNKIIQSLNTFPLFGSRRVIAIKETNIFYSKFSVEKIIEKSKVQFEANDITEAIRSFRMALGVLKIKEISELRDRRSDDLHEFVEDQKSEKWLNKMLEECLAQNLSPIIFRDDSDQLDEYLKKGQRDKGMSPQNILILGTEEVDKRKKLYKTISDFGVVINFSVQKTKRDPAEVEGDEKRGLLQKATELLKKTDKVFGKGSFEVLANKTGYNIGVFTNELEKVILSVKDNKKIEIKDIEEVVGRTKEDSIFDLQNALGRKDLERAMVYFKDLLGQDEPLLKILNGIANEIRHLIVAKEFIEKVLKGKWNRQMDVGAFKKFIYFPIILPLKKTREEQGKSRYNIYRLPSDALLELLRSAENFTYKELYLFMKLLAETDVKMKSVRVDPTELLEKALIDICSNGGGKVKDSRVNA